MQSGSGGDASAGGWYCLSAVDAVFFVFKYAVPLAHRNHVRGSGCIVFVTGFLLLLVSSSLTPSALALGIPCRTSQLAADEFQHGVSAKFDVPHLRHVAILDAIDVDWL